MPNTFNQNTFREVYKDDFRDSDHYHRILFNSGRPVQARELTQLQTILSREVERFGHNIFKEGAAVNPISNVFVNNKYRYVQVTQTSIPAGELVGLTLTGETSGVQAIILEVLEYVDSNNPVTLYVDYINTDTALIESGEEPVTFALGENIINAIEGVTFTVSSSETAVGYGTKASIGDGVFFVRGHFVFSQGQDLILSRYSRTPSADLGFRIIEDIVTVDDDDALYDNQGAVPNLSSPGADRYRIRLVLTTSDQVDSDQQFVYVAKVVDGLVVEINNGRRDYNRIYDVMAQRTYEESGNYAVKPFLSVFEEHPTDNSKLILNVQPGIGYVKGYRCEPGGQRIVVNKPTTTLELEDEPVSASYGNYVLVSEPHGLFYVDTYQTVDLKDNTNGGGNTIGTARVRSLESAGGGKYRLYLFAVSMASGSAFRDVLSIKSGAKYANTDPDGPVPELIDIKNNDLFFSLPNRRPDWNNAPSFDMTVQRTFSSTANGSGEVVVDTGGDGTFTQTSEWLVFDNTNTLVNVPLANFSASGGTSVTISGLSASTQYEVLTLVDLSNIPPRTKNVVQRTISNAALDSDFTCSLERADIIEIISITDDTTSADVTESYKLDNGQRDNYYGIGSLTLRPGKSAPASTITIVYKYFSHSTSGGYFHASSYKDIIGFQYSDIPSYRRSDGLVIQLREVIDFRPTINYTSTNFTDALNGGRVNELPRNTDTLSSSIYYYLPRNDLLVLTTDEELKYIEGVPSFEPQMPEEPQNTMALYRIYLGANAIDLKDLRLEYIDNRRYTMRDIGKLERRIEENRELITLSLLELETQTLEVLDENGLSRTKAGFFVDNFTNYRPSDVGNPSFLASLDVEEGIMRPHHHQKELSYIYDSASSSNVKQVANAVMLNYTHEVYIDQPKASGIINVNPFNVITNNGVLELTPTKDVWKDEKRIPAQVEPAQWSSGGWISVQQNLIRGLERLDPNYRNWDWAWWGRNNLTDRRGVISSNNGRNADDFMRFLDAQDVQYTPKEVQAFVHTHGQIGVDIQSNPGGRVTKTTEIPFMRSREVAVKVTGLMPSTRHFPYFDQVDVSKWCKSITESEYNALVSSIYSANPPIYETRGMTELSGYTVGGLVTDTEGTLYIKFLIPNTDEINFPTGTREFAVYDITTPVAASANSQAAAEYVASGLEEEITETGSTVRLKSYDPIAQSFQNALAHGVFLTKVGCFVAAKDDSRPLICEIRPLVNGYPSASERLRYGIATLKSSEIVPSNDASVETVFEFRRPVYLEAETEYAIVLRSESNKYYVWQATMGEFELGSSTKRISAQPYMGSLFSSQNGSTWEPNQDKDLKFKAYIANFSGTGLSGRVNFNNSNTPEERLPNNPFVISAGSTEMRVIHPYHGMIEGDYVRLTRWSDADSDASGLVGYTPAQLATDSAGKEIFNVDITGYSITMDSAASINEDGGSIYWNATANMKFQTLRHALNVFQPKETTLSAYHKLTKIPSLMQDASAGYLKDATRTSTVLQKDVTLDNNYAVASALNETNNISSAKSLQLEVDITTTNQYLSPVFNLDEASFMAIENVIDWQDDSDIANRLVPWNYIDESEPLNGSSLSKYISKEVAMANSSTGLKIIVAVNKPTAASFDMYYKIANENQNLEDQPWVLIEPESPVPSDDKPGVYREYRYIAGGLTGTLQEFTKFKTKIVMNSYNEAKIPTFKDLRVIAMSD